MLDYLLYLRNENGKELYVASVSMNGRGDINFSADNLQELALKVREERGKLTEDYLIRTMPSPRILKSGISKPVSLEDMLEFRDLLNGS